MIKPPHKLSLDSKEIERQKKYLKVKDIKEQGEIFWGFLNKVTNDETNHQKKLNDIILKNRRKFECKNIMKNKE